MERHVVIGTAGHIDHGKTTLVKALTGKKITELMQHLRPIAPGTAAPGEIVQDTTKKK